MKIQLFLLLICVTGVIHAQKPGQAGSLRLFENNRPFTLPDGQGNDLELTIDQIEGSPYLKNEFLPGKIYHKDENAGTFLIRYNIYNDVMEIKFEQNDIQELLVDPNLKTSIGTSRFMVYQYIDDLNNPTKGYFEILSDGKRIDLLKKHHIKFSPGAPAKSSFHKPTNPEFKYSSDYYFLFKDQDRPVKIKKLKESRILELLTDEKTAKDLIKNENLDISKERDLIKLVEELNKVST